MKAVSYTSQWTAAARAIETERKDALFHDPFARHLAGKKGFDLLKKYGGGGLQDFVAIRTKYLDDVIKSLVMYGSIRQVALVAAGMDMRSYRLSWPTGTTIFEIDHSELHQEKQKYLNQLHTKPMMGRKVVLADLSTDWLPTLYEAGFDKTKPTLWIAEALLFFLTDAQVRMLLTTLASASTIGSWLTLDVLSENLLHNISAKIFLNALHADGIPWLFGTNEPERYFQESGWEVTEVKEPGQEGTGIGRWPYQVFPRNVPNISRNWLIKATVAKG